MQLDVNDEEIWFSHQVSKYEVEEIDTFAKFKGTNEQILLDWDKCILQVIGRLPDNSIRIVLRSKSTKNSGYMGKDVRIRYMMGIDIRSISPPIIESYTLSEDNFKVRDNFDKKIIQPKNNQRVVFQLDDRYWIWDWLEDNTDIKTTNIYKIYEYILSRNQFHKSIQKRSISCRLEDEEIDK